MARSKQSRISGLLLSLFTLALLTPAAQAQTFTVLHTFTGSEGGQPGPLIMDAAGNMYGSAMLGGKEGEYCQFAGLDGCGAVFELKRTRQGWLFLPLYIFQGGADGARPGPVVFGPEGALYGTTTAGGNGCPNYQYGCGTIFKLTPSPSICKTAQCSWLKTTLYSFAGGDDGWNYGGDTTGPVTFAPDGSMYGATQWGGQYNDGTVFKLTPSHGGWTESVLHSFQENGYDGFEPSSGVILDQAGNLYGVTPQGGVNYAGTVYELIPSGNGWTETILHTFNQAYDYSPEGGLMFDQAGNLYGSTTFQIDDRAGTIFKMTPYNGSWTYTVLYVFSNGLFGGGPKARLTLDASGNIYGTTWDAPPDGLVFKLTPYNGGWTETTLHQFTAQGDGAFPASNILLDGSGNLYGTAGYYGGDDWGTVWEITP